MWDNVPLLRTEIREMLFAFVLFPACGRELERGTLLGRGVG